MTENKADKLRILKLEKLRRLKIKQAEKEEAERLESKFDAWRKDPALWLVERFGERPEAVLWELFDEKAYKKHKWDGTKNPLFELWSGIAENKWVGVMSGTGTGKTYILSRIVFWFLDCWENSLVVTSAPKQDQLRLHLWSEIGRSFHKFQAIRPNAQKNKLTLYADVSGPYKDSWMAEGFVAGVEASSDSTTKAQGFHRKDMLIIMEETPGMPMPTMTAFVNTATGEHNPILAVGNPDSQTDTLSLFVNSNPAIKKIQVSSYDHPNIVLKKDMIPGAVSETSIAQKASQFGTGSAMFDSRVRGICPAQSIHSLIRIEWIRAAWLDSLDGFDGWDDSRNAAGVDVANSVSGDAGGVAFGRQNVLTFIREFQCPNASHIAYNLMYGADYVQSNGYNDYDIPTLSDMQVMPENVGLDTVGLGVSTLNAFQNDGFEVLAINGGAIKELIPKDERGSDLYSFSSVRQQILWLLRDDLQHGRIKFCIADKTVRLQIEKELANINYKITERNIVVEAKENIKQKLGGKSPTYLDIIAYWNLARRDIFSKGGDLPFYMG
jgi:hypothetical protein